MTRQDTAMHALLVGLATSLFVLQPLADLGWVPAPLPPLVTLGTMLAGMAALTDAGRILWPIGACLLVVLGAIGLDRRDGAELASMAGLLLLCRALLGQVLAAGAVTRHRIEGAIALYLLIALLFATAYETLEDFVPGAFVGATSLPDSFRYFSLIVQTSTGFGDIVPAMPLARTLVTMQAVTGQIFVAVLLARLVSLELAARAAKRDTAISATAAGR
jgi:hypothetical protein